MTFLSSTLTLVIVLDHFLVIAMRSMKSEPRVVQRKARQHLGSISMWKYYLRFVVEVVVVLRLSSLALQASVAALARG